ncbi:phosphatidylinositol-binding protein scs2 [Tulasnella sp. 419]|nr:phosphatidylinositol-binding protein scs2 [Tulasnella sp. 418]KAG8961357.1 phosphatidylinositol-binding protein scs2 [Tulasnella sp. 419]
MSIQLEPNSQLGFNRPLTQVVKKSLTVRNPNAQPIAFKVKTTAPKLYCVRPNSGRVEPGESVEVSVILQAMKEEPPLAAKCKDKFLVQSTFITPEKESLPLQDIWATTSDASIHQQKVKVVYLAQGVDSIPENEGFTQSMMSEGESQFNTVRPSATNGHPHVGHAFIPIHQDGRQRHLTTSPPHERSVSPAQGEYIIAHEETTHQENQYGSVPPSPVGPSHRTRTPPNADLVVKYTEAQEEISRLKALVSSLSKANQTRAAAASSVGSGLRRRSGVMSDDGLSYIGESVDGETIVNHDISSTESGVPLQIVVIIALGVFVTTYLFF